MNRIYIVTIFILACALIFAIQNTAAISLTFLFWHFTGSQALVVILIFILGFICGWLTEARVVWKRNQQLKVANKKVNELSKPIPPAGSSAGR